MKLVRQSAFKPSPIVLGVIAVGCLGAGFLLAYQAGCAGDLKTGSEGDMERALAFEDISTAFHALGLLILAVAVATKMRERFSPSLSGTILRSALIIVLGWIPVWFVAVTIEDWGIRSCL